MNEALSHIVDLMPLGVIVYDEEMRITFRNKRAELFMKRHELPDEIPGIADRMFAAIKSSSFNELFPGEIYLYKKLPGSQSRWTFKLDTATPDQPSVIAFISEDSVSDTLDLLGARRKYKWTRRETDVVRRVVSGLKNGEIADEMEISEQTVKDHLSNIYEKVGVRNRMALVRVLMDFRISE